jgi:V/A-type H+-transporting ATPase subunit E
MEMQLDEFVQKIKKDGVVAAKQEAEHIIAKAREEAATLIKEAQEKAKYLEHQAQEQAHLSEQRGRTALVQASRDLLLNMSSKITALFDAALGTGVAQAMSAESLPNMIKGVLQGLSKDKNYAIELSPDMAQKIGDTLKSSLNKELGMGIDILPTKMVQAGFRIQEIDGKVSYDFSDKVIAQNLAAYVNPKLAEDIKKAAGLA